MFAWHAFECSVKVKKEGASIEGWYYTFFNEIIEYDIINEEPARFKKNNYNNCSNYRQNT